MLRRFDVKDPDPDPDEKDAVYRAKPDQLLPIPTEGSSLPTFSVGKQVLARYPDTTTFYKAEVMAVKKDVYRLRFEGEEDDKEMDVDRRFVLDDK
jgi:SAGA-associated factor 29